MSDNKINEQKQSVIEKSSNEFKVGREKTGGRAKGTPNKTTSDMKMVISQVVEAITRGDGINQIVDELIEEAPKELLNFLSKVAPKELNVQGNIKTEYTFKDPIEKDV